MPRGCGLLFVLCLCVGFWGTAFGQSLPSTAAPGRDQLQYREPAPPKSQPGSLIAIPAAAPAEQAAKIRMVLRRVIVEGSTSYAAGVMEALFDDLKGKTVSVGELYAALDRIKTKYSDDGYLLVVPVVVPQEADPKGATIHIKVVEAYVDRVVWPAVLKTYRDFFSECAAKITAERPARLATIERCLLLARDLPGLAIGSTLKRSSAGVGATTLIIDATEKHFDASARIDNRGAAGRGPWEYTASATANNLFHDHESFGLTYASAFDPSELKYIAGNYHQVLTADGLALDGFLSYSTGAPGLVDLRSLGYATDSLTSELGLTYPLIRAREQNFSVGAVFFTTDARSDVLGAVNTDDRLRGFRVRLNGDKVDTALGTAAITQAALNFSHGIEGFGSTHNGDPQASVLNGRVDFTKIDGTISRTQAIAGPVSLFASATGQYAFTPLLVPELCSYGGHYFGRAFDPNELGGDRCWAATAELRYDLPLQSLHLSQSQLYGYADHGDVYRIDPSAGTPEHLSGSSAGLGVRLEWNKAIDLNLEASKPLDGRTDNGWRYFVMVGAKW